MPTSNKKAMLKGRPPVPPVGGGSGPRQSAKAPPPPPDLAAAEEEDGADAGVPVSPGVPLCEGQAGWKV